MLHLQQVGIFFNLMTVQVANGPGLLQTVISPKFRQSKARAGELLSASFRNSFLRLLPDIKATPG